MTSARSGRCPDCGFDWETDASSLVPEIAATGRRFRAAVSRILDGRSDDAAGDALRARPAPDRWSVLEYLAHMRDIVTFFDDRIERVLTEDHPTMEVTQTFAELAEIRRYRDGDPAAVLDALDKGVAIAVARLGDLHPDQWQRVGIGSGGQARTVLLLARRLAHEACHHLDDIDRPSRPGP